MEFIIEHKTTKRKIKGAFNICGNRADLLDLAKQIEDQVSEGHSYGWINILPEKQAPIPDTTPLEWE